MEDNILGKQLRLVRKSHGEKQDEVAEFLGLKRAVYSHYECGRIIPSLDILAKLSNHYGVPLSLFTNLAPGYSESDETNLSDEDRIIRRLSQMKTDFINNAISEDEDTPLTYDDKELVYLFHKLSEKDKKAVLFFMRFMALND
nr:helix-turn-helix transcriptional regulator [uncultured Butyrivibrio sp.]